MAYPWESRAGGRPILSTLQRVLQDLLLIAQINVIRHAGAAKDVFRLSTADDELDIMPLKNFCDRFESGRVGLV